MPAALAALILTDDRVLALPDALRATLETALALCHANGATPVPLATLAQARRRAVATVRRHLAALARQGWPLTRRAGRALLVVAVGDAPVRVTLPARDETAPTATPQDVKSGSNAAHGYKNKIEALREEPVSPPPQTDLAVLEQAAQELAKIGVYPELIQELARLPWVTPALVRRCALALRARGGVRSLPALLVKVLRDRQAAVAMANAAPQRHCQAVLRAQEAARVVRESPPAADPALRALQAAWRCALVRLQTTWDPQAVALHLKSAAPLGAENGVLLLGVPSAISCDWLNLRARGAVLTALDAGVGQPLQDVRFVVARHGDPLPA